MDIKRIYQWITQSRIDTIAKLLPGIGAIIASIYVPLVISWNAESNRNNQLYVEVVSNREIADSELRAKMFENLLTIFFTDTTKQIPKEQLTLLRLIALNFHEAFDFKPLFEDLDADLTDSVETWRNCPLHVCDSTKSVRLERYYDGLRLKLRAIATEIVDKQEALLSQLEEGAVFQQKRLFEGYDKAILIPPDSQDPYEGHRLLITATKIGDDPDNVSLEVLDFLEENNKLEEIVKIELERSYYSMPFIDNTKLFNGTRFAITLKEIVMNTSDTLGLKAANINIMFFPETYMSSRDRPYVDEMLQNLKRK